MVILQVIHSLGNGGAEKFTVELSNELAKTNKVKLCSVKPIEEWMLPPKKISAAVDLIELDFKKKYSFILFCKLFRLVKKARPDVVHVHSSLLVFYFYILSLFFKKSFFLQTVHNTITPGYLKLFGFLQKMRFLNKDFVNVCISKSIYNVFSVNYPKINFKLVDNGIYPLLLTHNAEKNRLEIIRLKLNEKTVIFVAIGNYSMQKNFVMLARVFKRLEKEEQNAILLIIGKDATPNQQRYLEVEKVKGKKTFLLGAKPNIGDYLNAADALVSSSLMEGMPLVILEAFSMGLPVIATPAGGVVDLIENGVNGIIASGYQEEDLFLALKTFLSLSEQQKQKIRENNINKFTANYMMEACARKYLEQVYREN